MAHAAPVRPLARPLAVLTLAHLGLLVVWSLVVPTFRGPDEHVHHDLVRHLTETWSYPDYDELLVSRRTLDALGTSPVFPAHAAAAAADTAPPRGQRPGWADLGPDLRNGPPNQMPQHPPLYYAAAGAALRVIDGDGTAPLDRSVWLLRLLNAAFLMPLPLIAAATAARFTGSRAIVLGAAAGVLAVPQLTHVGASVSNDPLMVLLGALTLAACARLVTGDRRWGTVVATGALAGLTMFTKGFGVPLVPAVAVAVLLPLAHRKAEGAEPVGATLARAATVGVVALATGGWWWVRNVLAYGTPQPGVRLRDRVPGVEHDVPRFAGDFSERMVTSFWGDFGWFEAQLPIGVGIAMTVLVVVTAAAALWRRWPRVVLAIPVAVASAMVLSAGWGAFKKTGVSFATHGRYLFAGITGLTVLVALGIDRLTRGRTAWQPLVTLAVALSLQAMALGICLHRYWDGDGPVDRVRALVAFAPVPATVTVMLLITSTVAVGASLAAMATGRAGLDDDRQPGATTTPLR